MLRFVVILFCLVIFPHHAAAQDERYDLAYIWGSDLDSVLDYQQELEGIFSPEEVAHLRIVGRKGGEFGIIYNLDGTALSSAQLMVQHSEKLRKAGLSECYAIKDRGYFRLYNVSYGLGPNLDALKKVYSKIYSYLGQEVGKNLFIEQTDSDNYTLIYRRRGDRVSTYAVAKKHGKLLKKKKIYTSIIPENNNPVIFGESSHLDDTAGPDTVVAVSETKEFEVPPVAPKQQPALKPVPENGAPRIVSKQQPVVKLTPEMVKKTVSIMPSADREIEKNIEQYIAELRRKGELASDETTGWMVYDLTKGESVVDINADQMFQAASMIKPFVALAFFHQVKKGGLIYGPKSRRNMEAMIQRSNNAATNWVMKIAGGPSRCEEILRTEYGHIFKNTEIREYIPAGGRTYRNSAQPSDYVRFLMALWNDELPYGKEIRRLMSLPGRDRLYDGTPIPQGTLVYNKTGSTAHLCGDMGILVPRDKSGHRYPYALVGIIERRSRPDNYGNWMHTRGNVIRQVSTLVYEKMKKQYQLL